MQPFYVIEGLDGSGKSTQLNLLRKYLTKQEIDYEDIHFPKLNQGYFGDLIAEYLRGEFGGLEEVHPKLVALLFAADRHEHSPTLYQWLDQGKVLIADRYVNSNIAFQCAKLKNEAEKATLRRWILEMEYEYYKIPQPKCSIFLDVPFKSIEKSLTNQRAGEDRNYLKGKTDIHEENLGFQKQVRLEYLTLIESQPNFHRIVCADDQDNFLPPLEIHQRILEFLGLKQ